MHLLQQSWLKKKTSVGPGHASPTQQLRNGDYYKLSLLLLLSDDPLIEDDFCYSIILIYYLNRTSKFNWRQQRSNWSFHAGWSLHILKSKTNIFYNNTEWPPWFNKRQHHTNLQEHTGCSAFTFPTCFSSSESALSMFVSKLNLP